MLSIFLTGCNIIGSDVLWDVAFLAGFFWRRLDVRVAMAEKKDMDSRRACGCIVLLMGLCDLKPNEGEYIREPSHPPPMPYTERAG
jgi:hypothetical protein